MIKLLNLPEEITYDDAYQLALSLMNPRSIELDTVKRLISTMSPIDEDEDDEGGSPHSEI